MEKIFDETEIFIFNKDKNENMRKYWGSFLRLKIEDGELVAYNGTGWIFHSTHIQTCGWMYYPDKNVSALIFVTKSGNVYSFLRP